MNAHLNVHGRIVSHEALTREAVALVGVFYRADQRENGWACSRALTHARERLLTQTANGEALLYTHCLGVAAALVLPASSACHEALEGALATFGWQRNAFAELPTCTHIDRPETRVELARLLACADKIAITH